MRNSFKHIIVLVLWAFGFTTCDLTATQLKADSVANINREVNCDKDCTFVLKKQSDNSFTVINPSRAEQEFTPYSTFKIANTLIALDTGVVKSLKQKLSFDKQRYPQQKWWPKKWYQTPLSIRDAFQHSAVPIYQQIASDIGMQQMTRYLASFKYGNRDISSGLDSFWLNGSIRISAVQQVNFLQRLFNQQLKLAPSTIEQFKQIMLVEQTDNHLLYAKTGGGGVGNNRAIGWYVGVIQKADDVYYFAVNLHDTSFKKVQQKRIKVARQQLKKLGILDN